MGIEPLLVNDGNRHRLISHHLKDLSADYGHIAAAAPTITNSTGKSHWGEGVTAEDMKALKWVKPEVVVEIAFTEWTEGGNVRHAAFAGLLEDKMPSDVHREASRRDQ